MLFIKCGILRTGLLDFAFGIEGFKTLSTTITILVT